MVIQLKKSGLQVIQQKNIPQQFEEEFN